MDAIVYQYTALYVPHRIERADRLPEIASEVVHYVGQNLGSARVDVVPHGRHQAEHGAEGGTIL
jgi:hypothetical protein